MSFSWTGYLLGTIRFGRNGSLPSCPPRLAGCGRRVLESVRRSLFRIEQYDSARETRKTYISMIARSRAIDRLRYLSRSRSAIQSLASTPSEDHPTAANRLSALEEIESQREGVAALRRLDDTSHRQVLELAFFEGLSYAQISSRLGMALGTVKSNIRRGLAQLKRVVSAKRSGDRSHEM